MNIRAVKPHFEHATIADCLREMQKLGLYEAKTNDHTGTALSILKATRREGAPTPQAEAILSRLTPVVFNSTPGSYKIYVLFRKALGLRREDSPYKRVTVHIPGKQDGTLLTALPLGSYEVDWTNIRGRNSQAWLAQVLSELPLDPHPTSEKDFAVLQRIGHELGYLLLENPWNYLVQIGSAGTKDTRVGTRRDLIGKCSPHLLAKYLLRVDIDLLCEVLEKDLAPISELDLFQVTLTQDQVDQLFKALNANTTVQTINLRGVLGGPFTFPFASLKDNLTLSDVNLRGHQLQNENSRADLANWLKTSVARIETDDPQAAYNDEVVGFPKPQSPEVYREELLGMLPHFPANLVAELLLHVDPELLSQLLEHNTIGVTKLSFSSVTLTSYQLNHLLYALDKNKTVVEFDGSEAVCVPEHEGEWLSTTLFLEAGPNIPTFQKADLPKLIQFIESAIQELRMPATVKIKEKSRWITVTIHGALTRRELQTLEERLASHDFGKAVEFYPSQVSRQDFSYPSTIFPNNATLEVLRLPGVRWKDHIDTLNGLFTHSQYRIIDLSGRNKILPEHTIPLTNLLLQPESKLEHLELSDNLVADPGVEELVHLFCGNTTLTYLGLRNCSITDDGARSIASALRHAREQGHRPAIREIDLTGNPISQERLQEVNAALNEA